MGCSVSQTARGHRSTILYVNHRPASTWAHFRQPRNRVRHQGRPYSDELYLTEGRRTPHRTKVAEKEPERSVNLMQTASAPGNRCGPSGKMTDHYLACAPKELPIAQGQSLRCRILDRIRRFFRPIFRRPFPVFFVPTQISYSFCFAKSGLLLPALNKSKHTILYPL